jgi:hypothetical protein
MPVLIRLTRTRRIRFRAIVTSTLFVGKSRFKVAPRLAGSSGLPILVVSLPMASKAQAVKVKLAQFPSQMGYGVGHTY